MSSFSEHLFSPCRLIFHLGEVFQRTHSELRQINFNVDNHKKARWDVLRKRLIAELDTFISQEVDKIYNVATNFYAAGN